MNYNNKNSSYLYGIYQTLSAASAYPKRDLLLLLEYIIGTTVYSFDDVYLSYSQKKQLDMYVSERLVGKPLAYIIQSQDFWKHRFYVNENTLIPRTDSEILIETVLEFFLYKEASLKILDIGIGSGCLLYSLMLEYQNTHGVGSDISYDALKVARSNMLQLGLSDRTFLVNCSLFDCFLANNQFDIIVSNPPYISYSDENITNSVAKYEPQIALRAQNGGLWFYQKIFNMAHNYMKQGAYIFMEIGINQLNAVLGLIQDSKFTFIAVRNDLNGIPRIIISKLA